jgi:hypothetical protein
MASLDISDPETNIPRRKVAFGGFTGSVVTLIVIVLNTYVFIGSNASKKVPPELSSSATAVLSFLVSYLVPPDPREGSTGTGINTKSTLRR